MKTKAKLLLLVFIMMLLSVAVLYASEGTTALPFLQMPAGARYIAMGAAGTAFANDSTAMYWNPGLMVKKGKNSFDFMHSAYLEGSSYDYASFGYQINEKSALGVSLQYFSYGKVEMFDMSGNDVGSVNPYDVAVAAGYSVDISGFGIGISGKIIRSKLEAEATAFAFDLGISAPKMFDGKFLSGLTISNIGSGVKYDQESEKLPGTIRLGGAYQFNEHLLAAMDIGVPFAGKAYCALGAEYSLPLSEYVSAAFRGGYNTTSDAEGVTGLTAGFGLGYRSFIVNYAFVPFGNLGITHRISLTYFWL
ncbi:MAG: PorV/PorQ family protein [Endomicrobia bacterium]|nr:PorV/PorQ family protein [Endomicrobiia bacterium]MCL2506692.1 PorV/PorQ family protein [Endomicrobiia bacterium]